MGRILSNSTDILFEALIFTSFAVNSALIFLEIFEGKS
jgi:hypothetical protein